MRWRCECRSQKLCWRGCNLNKGYFDSYFSLSLTISQNEKEEKSSRQRQKRRSQSSTQFGEFPARFLWREWYVCLVKTCLSRHGNGRKITSQNTRKKSEMQFILIFQQFSFDEIYRMNWKETRCEWNQRSHIAKSSKMI